MLHLNFFYVGTRITLYERLRTMYSSTTASSETKSAPEAVRSAPEAVQIGLAAKLAMGLTAGALGQLIAVPADLIKVGQREKGKGW
jgi:solute carrier family 25 uncoupling protein 27